MAAPTEEASHSMEKHFAQHLAANETKIRDRAVRKISRWITAKSRKDSGFNEEELLRIWKGLYYCMWMSDKMIVQEDLADKLSEMMHCFKTPEQGLLYYETFLRTMKKEWNGIDYLRVDKFLMLYRRMFRQALILLKKQDWQESLLTSFMDSLRRHPFNTSQSGYPDGLRFFLVDIYIEEVSRIGGVELSKEQVLFFLEPLVKLACQTSVLSLTASIMVTIFEEIVNQAWLNQDDEEDVEMDEDDVIFKSFEKKNKSAKTDGVKVFEELPMLEFDHSEIKNLLLTNSSQLNIPSKNRKRIYKTIYLYQNLLKGCHPAQLIKEDKSERMNDNFLEVDNPRLAERLKRKKKQAKERKKKKRLRKRLEKQALESDQQMREDGEGINEETGDEGSENRMEDEGNGEDSIRKVDEDEVKVFEDGDASLEDGTTADKDKGENEIREIVKGKRDQTTGGTLQMVRKQNEGGIIEKTEMGKKAEEDAEKMITGDQGDDKLETGNFQRRSTRKSAALNEMSEKEKSESGSLHMNDNLKDRKTKSTKQKKKKTKIGENVETNEGIMTREDEDSKEETRKKSELTSLEKKDVETTSETKPMRERSTRASRTRSTKVAEEALEQENVQKEIDAVKKPPNNRRGKKKTAAAKDEDLTQSRELDDEMAVTEETGEADVLKMQKETENQINDDDERKSAAGKKKKRKSEKRGEDGAMDGVSGVKSNSAAVNEYTPPVLRKRVKIALANNEELSSTDYHKRVQASPGIPFDKEKKPESPAIKPSPSPPKRTLRTRTLRSRTRKSKV